MRYVIVTGLLVLIKRRQRHDRPIGMMSAMIGCTRHHGPKLVIVRSSHRRGLRRGSLDATTPRRRPVENESDCEHANKDAAKALAHDDALLDCDVAA